MMDTSALTHQKDETYECVQCQRRWQGAAQMQPSCRCGSDYMRWLTWPSWRARRMRMEGR